MRPITPDPDKSHLRIPLQRVPGVSQEALLEDARRAASPEVLAKVVRGQAELLARIGAKPRKGRGSE